MKLSLSMLLAGTIAATTTAMAMPAGAATGTGTGVYPMDCAKWKDKARCAALNQDIQKCKDKTDDEWRECMRQSAPTAKFTPPKPRDCSTARNKERCEAYNGALEACKDKSTRAEHRKCIAGQIREPASEKK
jgi:hypothetical protein